MKVCCDYSLKVAVTGCNPGLEEELTSLTTAETGVNMFSVMMSGPDSLSDSHLIETLGLVARLGGLVSVHGLENDEGVGEGVRRVLEAGGTGPEGVLGGGAVRRPSPSDRGLIGRGLVVETAWRILQGPMRV